MKRVTAIPLLLITATLLCGCPYESPYAIDEQPLELINHDLLGKWAAMVRRPAAEGETIEQPVKLIFSERTSHEYDIAITGHLQSSDAKRHINNDTLKGTGFISVVDNRQFLNAFIYGKYYIAEIKLTAQGLHLFTLTEHFTAKFIKNSASLRQAIAVHYKTRAVPMYDEWFIARNLQKVN